MTPEEALATGEARIAAATTSRRSCPAASSSAWPSPAPSPSGPPCCSATSPPARSTSPPAWWCWRRSRGSTASWARPLRSSPTTPPSRDGRPRGPPGRRPDRGVEERDRASVAPHGAAHGEVAARFSALNRKLLRDLWQMKAQALAIAMVVAAGVAMFVMYLSNFDSLRASQQRLLRARSASPTCSPRSSAPRAGRSSEHRGHPRRRAASRRASSPMSRWTCPA